MLDANTNCHAYRSENMASVLQTTSKGQ